MKRLIFFCLFLAVFGAFGVEPVIVVPENVTPVEMNAARELRDLLRLSTHKVLTITQQPPSGVPAFFIGDSPAASSTVKTPLKEDEIFLKTLPGGSILLAGGKPHGPLYAVYEFMERFYGVRFWSSWETEVPERELFIPQVEYRFAPQIPFREPFYFDVNCNPLFATRLRTNGITPQILSSWGGHLEYAGQMVHTFDVLIPADRYFPLHPEWFALIDGKRQTGNVRALCLSNPELRREIVKNTLEMIREYPGRKIVSVSQNDNQNLCQCDACRAFTEKEGSPSGLLLLLVNEVARSVEKEFPDMLVDTLAYQTTRKPPKTIRPRSNVLIRLCSIEADFSKPLDSEANAAFRSDLLAWSAISPHLAVWNYVTDFANYAVPMPNWSSLGKDIDFFRRHHVSYIFEQGNYHDGGRFGDFEVMRAWVTAKLLWDPSQDVWDLIHQFLSGYYGPAAPSLERYLRLLEAEMQRSGKTLSIFHADTRHWLSVPGAIEARNLMRQARQAVRGNTLLAERVDVAALPIDLVMMDYYADFSAAGAPVPDNLALYLEEWIRRAEWHGIRQGREGAYRTEYFDALRKKILQKK